MVMHHHEPASCGRIVLLSWSHGEGLYNQNMIVSAISSELLFCVCLFCFWPAKFSLLVQHHKLECLVKRFDCCVQVQGHSNGFKLDVNVCQFVPISTMQVKLT